MAQFRRLIERLPLPIRPPNLTVRHELDRGTSGAVFEGVFDGQPVAVKALYRLLLKCSGREDILRNFCEECERIQKLDHPHVISEPILQVATLSHGYSLLCLL